MRNSRISKRSLILNHVENRLILSYLILSYLILSYLILSYLILSYLILSYPIISPTRIDCVKRRQNLWRLLNAGKKIVKLVSSRKYFFVIIFHPITSEIFSHIKKNDLDISHQLKRSHCMKRRHNLWHAVHVLKS